MWKWILLGVAAFLAWRWYKAGFVEVSEDKSTFNVKVRKLAGVLGVLDPVSKKDNINFGTVEAPAPNIDPSNGYWRTLNGSSSPNRQNGTGTVVIGDAKKWF